MARLALISLLVIIAATSIVVFRRNSTAKVAVPKTVVTTAGTIRYLPLGDSYTIGQSVAEADRWPNQLTQKLANEGTKLQIIANPSVTGYTTQNLIDRELPLVPKLKPDFVTVLIGVNDYVQGVDTNTFQKNLDYILTSLQKELVKPTNIALVTIPDYGKTPTGAQYGNPEVSSKAIQQFNQIIIEAGVKYKLPVADIFSASQAVASDSTLIANDGLHPSAKEYTVWTDIIYQTLKTAQLP